MHLITKRRGILLGLLGLVFATAAFAYWTTTGDGSGNATASSGQGVTLHATVPAGIAPGVDKAVTFTADNPTAGPVQVGTVHLEGVNTTAPGCATADFSMANVAENQEIAPGNAKPLTNPGTLKYADDPTRDQSACKDAILTLVLSST